MCDLQHKTTLRSILITSVITWYEVHKVLVKTLQRRRASGASVSGKLQPALLHRTSLAVQLVPRDVLHSGDMPLLGIPRRLDAIVVEQTHPMVSQPEGTSMTSMSAWIRIVVLSVPMV